MSKFLTYDERTIIQQGLTNQLCFGRIALQISKDRTTVAKEIRRNFYVVIPGKRHNACIHRFSCKKTGMCRNCTYVVQRRCGSCGKCNSICAEFKEEICLALLKPPYVCNGCSERRRCTLTQRYYDAYEADNRARTLLVSTRTGIRCTEEDITRINGIVEPLCRKGHSLHTIFAGHKDELMCSEKTLYNYVDAQVLTVRNIDLPRKVKYSARKKAIEFKVDRNCRKGRTFEDFRFFTEENPELNVVQMDSVIGRKGGKVLLTIYFVSCCLMLAFIRDANTAASVTEIFDRLDYCLGPELFEKLFPVILTDNGSEFSNPVSLETIHFPDGFREMYEGCYDTDYSKKRTRIFYCDPMASNQKGAIEVNHEFIRRVLPKGTSFDSLTQDDVDLMMNHINSYPRKKLNDRTPYETFVYLYGVETADALGCKKIAADEVTLTPQLLK